MTIDIHNLNRRFGSVTAADDVSFSVGQGSLTALLGPSGSGKTTILRMIAGLEVPDSGSIFIGGRDVSSVPAQKRNVGFVFQHYALFKHMKVAENIAFPLKVRHWKRDQIRERVAELVDMLKLSGLEKRYPDQVSGGQRQRVALARALAARPQVLLLDEPFSALDARVRDELREWLRALHDQLQVTSVFVTHDQTEAMEVAEQIVILRNGSVVQTGSPEQIVREPNSPFVVNFIGRANAIAGQASHGIADFGGIKVPFPSANGIALPVVGYFRPQEAGLTTQPSAGSLPVTVRRVTPAGVNVKVLLGIDSGNDVVAELPLSLSDSLSLEPGQRLFLTPWNLTVYPEAGATQPAPRQALSP